MEDGLYLAFIWGESKGYAAQWRHADPEDFASWRVLRRLEGVGLRQSVEHAFKDYLDENNRVKKRHPKKSDHRDYRAMIDPGDLGWKPFGDEMARSPWFRTRDARVFMMFAMGWQRIQIARELDLNPTRIDEIYERAMRSAKWLSERGPFEMPPWTPLADWKLWR